MSGSIFFEAKKQTIDDILKKHPKPGGYWKEDGGKIKIAQPCVWFTNLDHDKRHEELILYRTYTPEDYPTYDNYNAIEVSKTLDIPKDYAGAMGVPITFLDKYNPDQFEITGITKTWFGAASRIYPRQTQVSRSGEKSDVTKLNDGPALLIKGPTEKTHYIVEGNYYEQLYARILIRNRALQP